MNRSFGCWPMPIDDLIWTFDVSVKIRIKKASQCNEVGLAKLGGGVCTPDVSGQESGRRQCTSQRCREVEIRCLQSRLLIRSPRAEMISSSECAATTASRIGATVPSYPACNPPLPLGLAHAGLA